MKFRKRAVLPSSGKGSTQSGGTLRRVPRLKMEAEPVSETSCFIRKLNDGRSPKEQIMSVDRITIVTAQYS